MRIEESNSTLQSDREELNEQLDRLSQQRNYAPYNSYADISCYIPTSSYYCRSCLGCLFWLGIFVGIFLLCRTACKPSVIQQTPATEQNQELQSTDKEPVPAKEDVQPGNKDVTQELSVKNAENADSNDKPTE